MKIINKRLAELKPYENNPRLNDGAVDAVVKSIKEFGFKVPVIITKDNVIIAGHTRYKAAKLLGLDEVPCIVADDLTPEQIKAFRIADNKTSDLSDWDIDKLKREFEELSVDVDFDLELTAFTISEISKILDEVITEATDEPPADNSNFHYQEQYGVIVICADEAEQKEIYESLTEQGYSCKVVAT